MNITLKPIRTLKEHETAVVQLEALWNAAEGTQDADALEVLSMLIEQFEEKHCAIEEPDPICAIEFRIEQAGCSRKALEPLFGNPKRISKILNKEIPLSLHMIRELERHFAIPTHLLVTEYTLKKFKKPKKKRSSRTKVREEHFVQVPTVKYPAFSHIN